MVISVLMVCLGNICRSPIAEAALRHHARDMGLDIEIDSAGTGDWHIGHPPDKRAQEVAKRLGGIDISGLRARQVSREDFLRFDHIIAMDDQNLRNLKALAPADATARLSMLLDHLPGHEGRAVADPYYGDDAGFETTWREVDAATKELAKRLASS
ncbi:MAG: low molecular weight protein-tyrosine-phosphatase [Sphingorhabdus sp.]